MEGRRCGQRRNHRWAASEECIQHEMAAAKRWRQKWWQGQGGKRRPAPSPKLHSFSVSAIASRSMGESEGAQVHAWTQALRQLPRWLLRKWSTRRASCLGACPSPRSPAAGTGGREVRGRWSKEHTSWSRASLRRLHTAALSATAPQRSAPAVPCLRRPPLLR